MEEIESSIDRYLADLDTADRQELAIAKPRRGGFWTAVDAKHHLIVAHEVITTGSDWNQLSTMAKVVQEATCWVTQTVERMKARTQWT